MARKPKSEQLEEIHAASKREFEEVYAVMQDERSECLEDRRFYSIAGAQWEGELGEHFENRLRLEFNKVHLAIIRIFNEYRNNRISVAFRPKAGAKGDTIADTCAGLFRADAEDSGAEEATDLAFEEATGGGFGAFRLCTAYEDEEDEDDERQRIKFKPIPDADQRVFFDLEAQRQDKADAKKCWVIIPRNRQTYEEETGKSVTDWPAGTNRKGYFDWFTPDSVYLVEYYVKETKKRLVATYEDITGKSKKVYPEIEAEKDPEWEEKLLQTGHRKIKEKRVKTTRVHKYLMDGQGILEDEGFIVGKEIPVIPVYGKRWYVENVERCMGQVRLGKDPQRLKNVQLSKAGELAAASSYEKPIFTPQQIAGHQNMWEDDPVKDYPYLLLNPMTDANGQEMPAGPVAYTKPPNVPPAVAALIQLTEQDLKEILGNQQQAEQMVSNISQKTVEAIQQRLDMQTFIYMSNMAKAMKRAGEVWLSMAQETYVEEKREMKTIGSQGEEDQVTLLVPKIGEAGATEYENDLGKAKLEVSADVGPSSSSKRQAIVRELKELMSVTADPETLQVLSAMIMMNMEGEGISEVRDFFRQKLLRLGVVKPTQEEAQKLAEDLENRQPSPQDRYLAAAADEATANAVEHRAKTIQTLATADKAKAEILEILAGITAAERTQALEAARLALEMAGGSGTGVEQLAPSMQGQPGETGQQPGGEGQPPLTNAQGWPLHQDANGTFAYVGPNGEIEEVGNAPAQ